MSKTFNESLHKETGKEDVLNYFAKPDLSTFVAIGNVL